MRRRPRAGRPSAIATSPSETFISAEASAAGLPVIAHGAGVGRELAVARQRAACRACPIQPISARRRRRASSATSPGRPRARRRCSSASPGPPTTVITAASRLATCASSCAITASSSRGSSRSSRPCGQVQAEAAAVGALDPAVGQRLALEHDRRLRQVGDDAQALDDRVQLGRVGGREPAPARGDRDALAHADADAEARAPNSTTTGSATGDSQRVPRHHREACEQRRRARRAASIRPTATIRSHQPGVGGEEVAPRPHASSMRRRSWPVVQGVEQTSHGLWLAPQRSQLCR